MKSKLQIKLTTKELAALLPPGASGKPRSRGYVSAMHKKGFTGTTLREAKDWLTRHPSFSWASAYLPADTRCRRGGKTQSPLSPTSGKE